ncbi:MAG TPA: ribose-5-phosphate isomerase RpiA [Tepidisphaeraceae bacterium]|jgi:ribose 5-phosphate isomerase A|nr:ribose-5-phosphate isomerase RpiA [Tepidisphaeraceae bacterium]
MNPKQRAAEAALQFVTDGMSLGLGTGTTADCFLIALSAALKSGRLKNIVGVPTSVRSQQRSEELGIPLTTLADRTRLDVTIDGADEISPRLDLIKGLGGALLREKMVAQHSAKLVIIADASKTVGQLGTKQMLPVEVVQFAHEAQAEFLRALGCTPALRLAGGKPFVTDNSNFIYDCRFPGIANPRELEAALQNQAGIVEHGLFLGMADVALIADENSVETRQR